MARTADESCSGGEKQDTLRGLGGDEVKRGLQEGNGGVSPEQKRRCVNPYLASLSSSRKMISMDQSVRLENEKCLFSNTSFYIIFS